MQCRRIVVLICVLLAALPNTIFAQQPNNSKTDSLKFPIKDRRSDPFNNYNNNPFDLKDTGYVKRTVDYDPKTGMYYVTEKIGNKYYRNPTALTFDEFMKLRGAEMERENFMKRAQTNFNLNRKLVKPNFKLGDELFNRIFGTGKISINPTGNVDLTIGYQGQNTKNPTLPERARKYGALDFDMNTQFNLNANIGDKLKLPINYNTLANFDFENQIKLDYKGKDDEIIKSIEAGNISFATKSTLIPGVQALFGLKTQLQFGKLFVTGAIANQRSQRQTQNYQGGASVNTFDKKMDDYDENKHFLLGHYFRNNYNKVMSSLPFVQSQVNIMRLEVWVTNRTGQTTNSRNIVALADLGERQPYSNSVPTIPDNSAFGQFPQNNANGLYNIINSNSNYRQPSMVSSLLSGTGLRAVQDFEKTFARKLVEGVDYIFNRQVGFISLNQLLQPDEVLGVAYQYTYNGRVYQVGEFAQDVALDTARGIQNILFVKMLKATSQRPNLPIWDLMMKNVYALDMYSVQREGLKINITYQEPSGGEKRMLPEGTDPGRPLLRILRLDRLNNNNDPQPDGLFDYIDSFTIQPQYGRIIFPVLEPFGSDLDSLAFGGITGLERDSLRQKYLFQALYDTTKTIAQMNYAQNNRFNLRGEAKSSGAQGDDIYLNAINIPQGSVTVTAGGQLLKEGIDYTIDYSMGKLTVINQAIKNSGVPVSVNLENNMGFGIQNRSFMGLRLDYLHSDKLTLGATFERLSERPFFTKTNYGEDPIRNSMMGMDFNYKSDWKRLTKLLDKLPFYSTNAPSSIQAYGEVAALIPGTAKQISGLVYLDDFEGSRANIDMRFPFVSWAHASTPAEAGFANATNINDLSYNYERAKLSWYQIEPVLQDSRNPANPITDRNILSDHRTRRVSSQELFPQRSAQPGLNTLVTFDLSFYPKQRGTYNYDWQNINADGTLRNPRSRWGGLMRAIDQTDFESANIEFMEFWLQDPFQTSPNVPTPATVNGGKLFINFGNVSEDILKDGKRFYENGLPTPSQPTLAIDEGTWGKTPLNPIQITQAFSTDPTDRPYQDVGLDGLNDDEERNLRRADYLDRLATTVGTGSLAYQLALADPSTDNFVNYRSSTFSANTSILERYKNFNLTQGNSPVTNSSTTVEASTMYPDNEDLNRDNTLNESEEYFEYEIDVQPNMVVGSNYITDRRQVNVTYENGQTGTETWYQFRVPINNYTRKVGNIPDFKSIRFMRMYLTDWEDSVNLRFARLDLVRNNWRQFAYELTNDGTYKTIDPTTTLTSINTLAVNIEENDRRTPIPYRIPPGIERVQSLANSGVNILQNEQGLSLQVKNLYNKQARGIFKTFNNDIRMYKKLDMFIHAEQLDNVFIPNDSSLYAVVRIGQDFLSNYYEVKIPLSITQPEGNNISPDSIWKAVNSLNLYLDDLINVKNNRNLSGTSSPTTYYSERIGNRIYGVYGNPNLGEVKGIFIGVENNQLDYTLNVEMWINELRLSQFDERPGYAATGRVDIQLADLGMLSVSASHSTIGFGTIDSRINERAREDKTQIDASLNIDAGKLLPKQAGLSIPVYASISTSVKSPEYDPYDKDIKLKDKLRNSDNPDSIKQVAQDRFVTKTLNISNMRVAPKAGAKPKIYSLSNFDITYNFLQQTLTTPTVTEDLVKRHRAVLGYTYTTQPKYWEPFKDAIKSKNKWWTIIKDFNLNPYPNNIAFRFDANRQFGRYVPRIVNSFDNKVERVDSTYDKYFNFDRFYSFRWELTRNLNIDYTATNKSRVDEPSGELNTKAKRDSMWNNFYKGGRNTNFNQNIIFTYNLPLQKIPVLHWTTVRASYTARYTWSASSLLQQAMNQGNIMENGSDRLVNGEFDFNRLYHKSRWLAALDNQPQKVKLDSATRRMQKLQKQIDKIKKDSIEAAYDKLPPKERALARKKDRLDRRNERKSRNIEISGLPYVAGKMATMLKRVSVTYGENYYSRIPGYTDSTQFFGNNFRKGGGPGFGYILGKTPNTAYLDKLASSGKITSDSLFNQMFAQGYDQKLTIQMQLEPIRDLIIDVNWDKSFSKNYTELFKDTTGSSGHVHLSPYASGSFNVTYISFQTMFSKFSPNETSATFKLFESYRKELSQRIASKNPYWQNQGGVIDQDGFASGYNRYSQDVLIPAFIAAYTKKDPNSVALIGNSNNNINQSPFKGIKALPNWRVTYNGLSKIPALQEKFSAISLTHAYQGRMSMNSFTSALLFEDPFRIGYPSFRTSDTGNFVPYFLIPNLTIQESFEPFIGVDITTTNQLSGRVEFSKRRTLSLSLIDYQLSEMQSTEFFISGSWRKKGLRLPFKLPKFLNKDGEKDLQNDITFRLDLSIRDDATSNSILDQNSSFSTAGQKVIKINPSIDYILNSRINLKLFFDQMRTFPYISTSAPTINTRAGVQIRISLAQ
ncbi:cell surface protein SprA [Chitinophagaceae bacterium LY-5]|uniref:Cell surface protein SprA n=2 Tax=Polluticaenibacter yanchengensis TaxID=3014562 RepID=A0ABT4UNT9_9BACT|nr:cell surface protein SprA [Chitinophagaceae bacterium LY-5]